MIKLEGRGFKSHLGQSFPLSLCGPISICRANAHMVYGSKHQHFTSHSITTIHLYNISFPFFSDSSPYNVEERHTPHHDVNVSLPPSLIPSMQTICHLFAICVFQE